MTTMRSARGCRETMSAFRGLRSSGNVCLVANDPQETCAGQDFRDAKMNQCGQRLRDRSPRGRSQPERVRRIGAPMNVSEKDTRDVARIWTDRRIPDRRKLLEQVAPSEQ